MSIVHLNGLELEKFLANFSNKTEIVRKAVIEYKLRHYEGIYFTEEEMLEDKVKYEKQLLEAKDKLEKINKLIKQKNEKDDKNGEKERA